MSLGINLSWTYREHILWTQSQDFGTRIYREPIVNLAWSYREPHYDASLVNLWWIYREPIVNLSWTCPRCQQLFQVWRIKCMKIMKFCLKWVHMARYELILRLDGALWVRIIFKPLLTPKGLYKIKKWQTNLKTGWGRALIAFVWEQQSKCQMSGYLSFKGL